MNPGSTPNWVTVGPAVQDALKRANKELAVINQELRAKKEENERLYREQLQVAEDLQSSLLHIPQEIGPVHLGHLYRSATEAAKVGGDFYDVFEVKEGKIAVLIGDVADVRFGAELRQGAVSHDGRGEVVSGIVMMTCVAYYISWSKRQDKPLPKPAPAKAG